jgi:hypothetical protein
LSAGSSFSTAASLAVLSALGLNSLIRIFYRHLE